MVRLPVGPAPLYTVDIVLEIYDSLGAAAVQRGCVLAESDFSTQYLPCRVRVEPPGSTPDSVLALVQDVGVSLLERAVGAGDFVEYLTVAAAMLSLLNSPTMQSASSSRRQTGSQLTRLRAVRDVIAASFAAQLNPAFAHLLSARTLSAAATTLRFTVHVPKQVSPSAQRLLLSCGTSILTSSALDTRSSTEDVGVVTSLLREALEYSKINAKEVSDTEALEQQDRLEAMLLSLSRKALASHTAGQDGLTMVFSTFVTFGRVFPVVRSARGGMATLKTQLTVQLGGVYPEWGQRYVSVIMPDIHMADDQVKLPSDASCEASGAAAEVIVSVWRGNASWVRGVMGHAPGASLLGQYVQVSLHWHGRDGQDGKMSIRSLPAPLRLGITTLVPNRSIHATTGRQSVVAACVYLGPSGRTWLIDGMSVALNSSSASPYATPSSATSAGSVKEAVVCEASHLTSFTVVAEEAGCDGVPRSPRVLDRCRVCGGNDSCLDCDGVAFGNKTLDPCGICGGSNKLETCLGCDGRIYAPGAARVFDTCQVCGGNGNHRSLV